MNAPRPYPRYCIFCKQTKVNRETILHDVKFVFNNCRHQISITDVPVDICSVCKETYFTTDTDEKITLEIEKYKHENSDTREQPNSSNW